MKPETSPSSEVPTFSHAEPETSSPGVPPKPVIAGYTVMELLGRGGMGTVWRAVQNRTRRPVALKVTHAQTFGSWRAQVRFEREVELAARLEHPHIARVYDSGVYQQTCFYAMEFIDGIPLDRYVQDEKCNVHQVVGIMLIVSSALQYAHQCGVIHRDLKPSNILITADGHPHILDFGLAKDLGAIEVEGAISLEGDLLGTPAFMSPEQAAGQHDRVDVRSDIYTLGVLLYYILTGGYPYEVTGPLLTTLRVIRESEPQPLRSRIGRCDTDLEAIIIKTLAKDPSARYQSVAELHHDLACWLEGRPIVIKSGQTWYLLRKIMARHRTTTVVVALMITTVLGFLGVYIYLYAELSRTHEQLDLTRRSLGDQAELYADLGQHILLQYYFLPLWRKGKIDEAQKVMAYFATTSREFAGAAFLMDPNRCVHKATTFERQLAGRETVFTAFIMGEQYLKEGDFRRAREAYERCLSSSEDQQKEPWLWDQACSRLYELGEQP